MRSYIDQQIKKQADIDRKAQMYLDECLGEHSRIFVANRINQQLYNNGYRSIEGKLILEAAKRILGEML